MKLHLPKQLFTALLAVITLAASHQAKAVSITLKEVEKSFDASQNYAQDNIVYVASTGDAVNLDSSSLKFDYSCSAALGSNAALVYVYSGSSGETYGVRWGISLGKNGEFKGVWNDDLNWAGTGWSATGSYVTSGQTTATADIDNGATSITVGAVTAGSTSLKASSETIAGVHFNTNYVSKIYYKAQSATLTNADSSWSKDYDVVASDKVAISSVDATLITSGRRTKVDINNFENANSYGGDLVVAGGQLWVDGENGAVSLDNNIILGGTTYSENDYSYGMRLRSNNYTTTLNGTLTLVENGSLRQEGGKATTFVGDVSGSGYVLTVGGADNLVMAGNVNLGGLAGESSRSSNITFSGADKTVRLGSVNGDNTNITSAAKLIIGGAAAERTNSVIRTLSYSNAELELNGNLSISEQATFSADAVITGAGNLQFHGGITGGATITKNGTGDLYLGAGAYNASLNVQEGTIKLGGTIAFGGSNTFTFGNDVSLIIDSLDGFSYTGASYGSADGIAGESGNGFRHAVYQVVSGSIATVAGRAVSVGGAQTVISENGTINMVDTSTYYLNQGVEKVETVNAAVEGTTANRISIAGGTTLQGGSSSASRAMQLTGSGTYSVTAWSSGITLAPEWCGTVSVSDANFESGDGIPLEEMGNANSIIELKGVTSYQPNDMPDRLCESDIKLSGNGWTITNGWAANHNNGGIRFTGDLTGEGNLTFNMKSGDGFNQTYKFEGDVSAWSGAIQQTNGSAPNTYLHFTGSNEFNASVDYEKGTLHLTLGNATSGAKGNTITTTKGINVTSLTLNSATAALNANVTANILTAANTSVSLGKDATLTLGAAGTSSSIGVLDASQGEIVLRNGTGLTIGAAAATSAAHKLGLVNGSGSIILAGGTTTTTQSLVFGEGLSFTVNNGATLNLGGTLTGTVGEGGSNVVISGTVGVAEGIQMADAFAHNSIYASDVSRGNGSTSGYLVSTTYTLGTNIAAGEGYTAAEGITLAEDGTLTYTINSTDNSFFYVNENAVWDSTGFEDNTATHYVVASGCTLDVNWYSTSSDDMKGKHIVLKENATLVNGSTSNTGAFAADLGWQQLSSITLQGNASVGGNKQFGLLGGSYSSTTLTLNGHTLTKVGGNTFLLINTTVDAGVIDIQEGNIQVGHNQGDKLTDASQATVKFSGGSLTINGGDTFKIAGLTGDNAASKIKGWGNLELVGSGTYETEAALTGNTKITVSMVGGTQTLRADSGWQHTTANQSTEKIKLTSGTLNLILDGATLKQSSINMTGGTLNLSGSGIYDMGNSKTASVSGLDEPDWKGTVVIQGLTGDKNDLYDFSGKLSNSNSTLKLKGVEAWLSNDYNCASNIELENLNSTTSALKLNNGYSGTPNATFSGSISGSGDMEYTWTGGNDNGTIVYTISADTEDWNGKFISSSGKLNVVADFTRKGNVFSVSQDGGGVVNNSTKELTVKVGSSAGQIMFNGTISKNADKGNVNLNVTQNVVSFSKKVDVDSFEVASGAEAQIVGKDGVISSTSVVNSGKIKLGDVATVTSGSMTKVQMSSTGISGTATDGTKGSMSGAAVEIAQLAANTSFTIADMALTNTSITAATVDTKVNLKNIEAENVLLAQGAFTLDATANVETAAKGETRGTLFYNADLGVAEGSTLTLNLDVTSAVAVDQLGVYDITITLSGFGDDFVVTDALLGMVKFDAESWLGKELAGASFSVDTGDASEAAVIAAAANGVPTVIYSTGENVGALVITIRGLSIPEPTTSALSLLALAALAARRRRK